MNRMIGWLFEGCRCKGQAGIVSEVLVLVPLSAAFGPSAIVIVLLFHSMA